MRTSIQSGVDYRLATEADHAELRLLASRSRSIGLQTMVECGDLTRNIVFVAVIEGRIIGCAAIKRNVKKQYHPRIGSALEFDVPNLYLCAMFVLPQFRGSGIGMQLYKKRLLHAKDLGDFPIYVELKGSGIPDSIDPSCLVGMQFYETEGFIQIGFSKDADAGKVMALPQSSQSAHLRQYDLQEINTMSSKDRHTEDERPQSFLSDNSFSEKSLKPANATQLLISRGLQDLSEARRWFRDYLLQRSIDARIASAMSTIPRHAFVPRHLANFAYIDRYIWTDDTVLSTPSVVATMLQQLQLTPMKRVLEVGTGTGYQTCVLACLADSVFSIDRVESCIFGARQAIESLGLTNVHLKVGDGYNGWPESAPFDAIVAATAAPELPSALFAQLNPQHGRMVMPIGRSERDQRLCLIRRVGNLPHITDLGPTYFVPMVPTQNAAPPNVYAGQAGTLTRFGLHQDRRSRNPNIESSWNVYPMENA